MKVAYSIALALAFGLVGCTTTGDRPLSQRQKIEVTCLSVSTANKVLVTAAAAGKLSASAKAQWGKALDVTDPICNPVSGKYPTLSELAYAEFAKQAAAIQARRNAVGE